MTKQKEGDAMTDEELESLIARIDALLAEPPTCEPIPGLGQPESWIDVTDTPGHVLTLPVYRMADERYISCCWAAYAKQTGKRPGVFCRGQAEIPPTCTLAGGPVTGLVPCAFDDPGFRWERVKGKIPEWQLPWYASPEAWENRGDTYLEGSGWH
jgi:hypothetical protein